MFTLNNIPAEVYLVALDLMQQDRPANAADAASALLSAESRCDYHLPKIGGTPVTAFAAALAMYISLSGPFAEDGGEFAGIGGYQTAA